MKPTLQQRLDTCLALNIELEDINLMQNQELMKKDKCIRELEESNKSLVERIERYIDELGEKEGNNEQN